MPENRKRLTWIDTLGGPHLVVPEKHASAWEGGNPPSGGRVVQATWRSNPDEPANDYHRACSVEGWIGSLAVGNGQALVLTGDRLSAAYYLSSSGRHFLLRWVWAPNETALLDHFHDVCDQLVAESETEFRHPGGTVFLMDSVDVPGKWISQYATFTLPRGNYTVRTAQTKTQEIWIVIHEWCRAGTANP